MNGKLLLQQAIERLKGFETFVVTNSQVAQEIRKTFRAEKLTVPQFIIEPEPRDTAAAVGFGIRKALARRRSKSFDWVAVLSADHWMPDSKTSDFHRFLRTIETEIHRFPHCLFVSGSPASSKKKQSHSQFGWILPDKKRESSKVLSYVVKHFIEKPKGAKLAKVRASNGLINAGMFFGRPETFLKAYRKFYPRVLSSKCQYSKLPKMPIDRAIVEKFSNIRVVPQPYRWEDLGTWKDWMDCTREENGIQIESKNCYLRSDPEVTIYAFGIQGMAVIQSKTKILVIPVSDTRNLKAYLKKLEADS